MKRARDKGAVIGYFPAPLTEGKEFVKAHVRFFDSDLFHFVCDALVYGGDELSIGGRKFFREKGKKFWIIAFNTEESELNGIGHGEAPKLN